MSEPIVRKGERVTCTNGHVICECLEDLSLGSHVGTWGECFGNWRQDDIPKMGSMYKPKCAICSAEFIGGPPGKWDWTMHFEDGSWRP